jgi:hypothetical protein
MNHRNSSTARTHHRVTKAAALAGAYAAIALLAHSSLSIFASFGSSAGLGLDILHITLISSNLQSSFGPLVSPSCLLLHLPKLAALLSCVVCALLQ